jgi:hypothetical protein
MKLTLDPHDIYNRGDDVERAPRVLDRKDIKPLYHRVEKDSHNFGRVFRSLPAEVGAPRGGTRGALLRGGVIIARGP